MHPIERVPISAEIYAIERLCDRRLHQSFYLAATGSHGKQRVTFSTSINFTETKLPVVLYCPPMLGGRFDVLNLESTAQLQDVRLICPDR